MDEIAFIRIDFFDVDGAESTDFWECCLCGALVGSTELHSDWHVALEHRIKRAAALGF